MYAAFWERVQTKPNQTVYDGIRQGLSLIQNGENVIHLNYGVVVGHYKANPFISQKPQKIKIFGKNRPQYYSVILPFNSPLKPILQKGTNTLIQTGTIDHMQKLWVGTSVPTNKGSETIVLSTGQVFLAFMILLLTIGTAGCILLLEALARKFFEKR